MLDNLRSIFRKRRHCSEETPPPSEDPKILPSFEEDEGRPECNDDYSVAWPEANFNSTPADRQFKFTLDQPQEMEIDAQSAQRPSENNLHRQNSFSVAHSESSMNFDYLQGLRSGTVPSTSTAVSGPSDNGSNNSYGLVDDSRALDRSINTNERFVNIMDQIDARVEKLRKDALNLQEMKDYLLMSMDLIKSNEMLQKMRESEREEVMLYIHRVSSRLGTVELNVRTVRDNSQEDSLSQINSLIDTMIKVGDPVIARQRCQLYLNACCTSAMDPSGQLDTLYEADVGPIDKKFESALLGCTLDDQKNIKKRLQALMGYLNKQTVSH